MGQLAGAGANKLAWQVVPVWRGRPFPMSVQCITYLLLPLRLPLAFQTAGPPVILTSVLNAPSPTRFINFTSVPSNIP
jgi:hypothetical protein